MVPVFGAWTADRWSLYRRIHDRLGDTAGCRAVRYEPNRRRRREVHTDIDPAVFLGRAYPTDEATLRIAFTLGRARPHYRIHWWEPAVGRSVGWHQDETEPEYGPVHRQVEPADGPIHRQRTTYIEDEHPYRTFERRFRAIPDVLDELGWAGDE